MASTATPYGMKPAKKLDSGAFPAAMVELPMTTNSADAIYAGCLIALNGGTANIIQATPTTTRGTSTPYGVCMGIEYVDLNGQLQFGSYLPANAITAGYTKIKIKVIDDPDAIFQIQANGAVTAASVGLNAALANVKTGKGGMVNGVSTMVLDQATIAVTATLAVRIVGFATAPGSAVGDAYTDVLVKFNQGVHAHTNATGG